MAAYTRVGAVTGANKGIGIAIVRQLALQYPKSAYNDGPLLIYLTARNEERGKAALESLHSDPQLTQAKALRSQGGLTDVKYHPLDIDNTQSIRDFASFLKKEHPQGIDFLINNAGIALQGFDIDVVKKPLHCNYYGTLEATQQILPHIKDGGRLVNVASMVGHLTSQYSNSIRSRFLQAQKPEDITQLMEEFTSEVAEGKHEKNWPSSAYAVSKAGVIGMTKTIARQNAESGSKTLINCCCPGYVNTDMTKGRGTKTPDEGAQTPVLVAIGDIKGSNGDFWQNERKIDWAKA
ncbi:Carbonyl reductase [NADPH] 1 [Exophiala dermatitidis]